MSGELENKIKSLFGNLKKHEVQPHAFLKTRILANSRDLMRAEKKVFYWKLVSAFSVASLVLTLLVGQQQRTQKALFATNEPYVIHMNFSEHEAQNVVIAEITLPDDVTFHSERNPQIAQLRTLRLPFKVGHDGRTKLPFVVMAREIGNKKIQVRLLDQDNKVIRENSIVVNVDKRS